MPTGQMVGHVRPQLPSVVLQSLQKVSFTPGKRRHMPASMALPALPCAMREVSSAVTFLIYTFIIGLSPANAQTQTTPAPGPGLLAKAHQQRSSPSDLEIGGDLAALPAATIRYLSHEDLENLPQVSYVVSDDSNFPRPAKIRGVLLDELLRQLAAPESDLVVAICKDQYRSHYSRAYRDAHRPVLVLQVNEQPPALWPEDAPAHIQNMGPYMISHAKFTPSFSILSHQDEAQIPWGVVRLEFRSEKSVFGAIAPPGPKANDPDVQAGYRIAEQNCLRCHNLGDEGGRKAHRPWLVISAWAEASPDYFTSYVRNPKAVNPRAQMPGNSAYDDATLRALAAYFRTFSSQEEP
jgi:mono/diheme cytochrome c family protein